MASKCFIVDQRKTSDTKTCANKWFFEPGRVRKNIFNRFESSGKKRRSKSHESIVDENRSSIG